TEEEQRFMKTTSWVVAAALAVPLIASAAPGALAAGSSTKSSAAANGPANMYTKGLTPISTSVLAKYTNCDADGKPKNPDLKIAFAQTDIGVPWRVTQTNSFKFWVKKLCVPHFIWNQANADPAKELTNVSDLLAQKPNVLVLDPVASQPLVPAIEMAKKAGVTMIVIDRKLPVLPGPDTYPALIASDDFRVGYASAEAWIEKLKKVQKTDNPKANLALISGNVGSSPAIERDKGVEAAIKPYPGIKIVADQSGDWTLPGGRKVMESYVQRFAPGQLQGVFAASDETMLGARQALEAAHRTDLDGWFFDGDGQLQGIQAVADGFVVATTQFPPLYGEPSVQAAIALSQGVTLPGRYFQLPQKTFTCLTAEACAKTKAYIAMLEATGRLF
ncbi:MAG: substrate-binding domain-containing protein, partial [Acetobacteraceae bacterium]